MYSGGNKLPPLPGSKRRKIRQTNNQKKEHNFYLTTQEPQIQLFSLSSSVLAVE
jgi:hypothetical protein